MTEPAQEPPSLRTRAVNATLWSGGGLLAQQGVQFFVAIALARLLPPEDFGTVAVILVFAVIAQVFADSGFSTALIQKQELGPNDASSVFYFNVATSAALGIALWSVGPWIAEFYGWAVLAPLASLMALNLFINSLGSVQTALLTKRMEFRRLTQASVTATAVSGVLAVFLAWRGYGVWSLAFQTITASIVTVVLLWRLSSWRPELRLDFASLASLFRFGGFMLLSALLDRIYIKIAPLIIGKAYSVRDLGFYTRAESTEQLPSGLLSSIVGRVALPAFSAAGGDDALLRKGVQKGITATTLLNFPAMLGMLACAPSLVFTLFGEKWMPSVPFLQVLCLRGLFMPLQVINLNVLMARGHSDLFFRLEVIKKALGLCVLLIASQFSILAMAWGLVGVAFVGFLLNSYYTGVFLDYSAGEQLRDVAANFAVAAAMFCAVWPLADLLALAGIAAPSAPVLLVAQIAVGAAVFASLCALLRLPAFVEGIGELREQWQRRRGGALS